MPLPPSHVLTVGRVCGRGGYSPAAVGCEVLPSISTGRLGVGGHLRREVATTSRFRLESLEGQEGGPKGGPPWLVPNSLVWGAAMVVVEPEGLARALLRDQAPEVRLW